MNYPAFLTSPEWLESSDSRAVREPKTPWFDIFKKEEAFGTLLADGAELEYVKSLSVPTKYPGWLITGGVVSLFVCLIGLVALIYSLSVDSLNLGIASMFILATSFVGLSLILKIGEGIRNSGNLQQ